MKRTAAGTLRSEDVGQRVTLKGWVHRRRDLGGLIFLDLRDGSGIAQVVVHPDEAPDAARVLDPVRNEWVIAVEGEVVEREAPNPDMPTGRIEVVVSQAELLSRSEALPFNVDGSGETTDETRLRYRYLDLRRQALQRNLRLRSDVTVEILSYFREQGFVAVETPILTRSTPEGARDYLVPSRVHRGSFFALPQSPQLFKQILMVAGFERYVQIARCFRDEDLRADRQPEFTQVDVEMSFIDEEDVYRVIEGLFARVFPIVGVEPAAPFRRVTWADAMARYGTDRPDLRCDLEIRDLTDLLAESGFRAFRSTAEQGGAIRAVAVPGAADASRKQIDGWAEIARRHGAAGVLWLRRRDGELSFQVKDTLSEQELASCAERLELEDGALALVVAAEEPVAAAALGALRVELGREFGHFREDAWEFLWVTEFPLVEWDEEEQRWFSMNHPFTAPWAEDLGRLEDDPSSVRAHAYDVVLNGYEIGGGSLRIHDSELQRRVFGLLGIGAEEAEERFGFLLDALRFGAPPHGGIALGLDRMVMLMAGGDSLRDVIAFPKTTSGSCLMTEAPSAVDESQLAELGLELAANEDGEGR